MANGHGGARDGAGRPSIPAGRHKNLPKPAFPAAGVVLNSSVQQKRSRLTPLQFLLRVMRDETADRDLRLLCARTALPFTAIEKRHELPVAKPKPLGQKAERQLRAELAASEGIYATPSPPTQTQNGGPKLVGSDADAATAFRWLKQHDSEREDG